MRKLQYLQFLIFLITLQPFVLFILIFQVALESSNKKKLLSNPLYGFLRGSKMHFLATMHMQSTGYGGQIFRMLPIMSSNISNYSYGHEDSKNVQFVMCQTFQEGAMTKNVHRSTTFLKVSKHKKYKTNLMFLVT